MKITELLQCPFHSLSGWDCPGCGSQRALLSLLRGDILQAADHNLLLVSGIPVLLFYAMFMRNKVAGKRLLWAIAILVLSFGLIRNIPVQPFLYLASTSY